MSLYAPRAASTPELTRALTVSHELGLNRVLSADSLQHLDPDGRHLVVPKFPHERAGGRETELHIRCEVTMKVIGKDEGEMIVLDILPEHVETMTLYEQAIAS